MRRKAERAERRKARAARRAARQTDASAFEGSGDDGTASEVERVRRSSRRRPREDEPRRSRRQAETEEPASPVKPARPALRERAMSFSATLDSGFKNLRESVNKIVSGAEEPDSASSAESEVVDRRRSRHRADSRKRRENPVEESGPEHRRRRKTVEELPDQRQSRDGQVEERRSRSDRPEPTDAQRKLRERSRRREVEPEDRQDDPKARSKSAPVTSPSDEDDALVLQRRAKESAHVRSKSAIDDDDASNLPTRSSSSRAAAESSSRAARAARQTRQPPPPPRVDDSSSPERPASRRAPRSVEPPEALTESVEDREDAAAGRIASRSARGSSATADSGTAASSDLRAQYVDRNAAPDRERPRQDYEKERRGRTLSLLPCGTAPPLLTFADLFVPPSQTMQSCDRARRRQQLASPPYSPLSLTMTTFRTSLFLAGGNSVKLHSTMQFRLNQFDRPSCRRRQQRSLPLPRLRRSRSCRTLRSRVAVDPRRAVLPIPMPIPAEAATTPVAATSQTRRKNRASSPLAAAVRPRLRLLPVRSSRIAALPVVERRLHVNDAKKESTSRRSLRRLLVQIGIRCQRMTTLDRCDLSRIAPLTGSSLVLPARVLLDCPTRTRTRTRRGTANAIPRLARRRVTATSTKPRCLAPLRSAAVNRRLTPYPLLLLPSPILIRIPIPSLKRRTGRRLRIRTRSRFVVITTSSPTASSSRLEWTTGTTRGGGVAGMRMNLLRRRRGDLCALLVLATMTRTGLTTTTTTSCFALPPSLFRVGLLLPPHRHCLAHL